MKTELIFLLNLFIFTACVEEYQISDDITANYQGEIVIEGRIHSGDESVFYVTRTLPLNADNWTKDIVTDARITIIGQNGYVSQPAEYIEDAKYTLPTEELDPNTLYAVQVEADGETFQSEYQPLLTTPDIDEITYKERDDKSVSFHVTTHDEQDAGRYYMWVFEEDWEFHADYDPFRDQSVYRPIYNEKTYPMENLAKNPYYYCWGHNTSYTLNLYTTDNLAENTVKEHEIQRIYLDDIRISYIYSMLLKQWSVTKEAYEYFRLMKLHTEDSGSLFSPMPSDVRGNIRCISNPDVTARGYVMASNIKEKRIFMYEADLKKNRSEYENCFMRRGPRSKEEEGTEPFALWKLDWAEKIKSFGAVAISVSGTFDYTAFIYSAECVDCRQTPGATKKRPDFWPNNHE